MPLNNVDPGDLITSDLWNAMVAALNTLEGRVADLENNSTGLAPAITEIRPAGPWTVGDTIEIVGSNFQYDEGLHSVYFGDARASIFSNDSSDDLLIVQVPDEVPGATDTGAPVVMTVSNQYGFTTYILTLLSRPEEQTGGLVFSLLEFSPDTPLPGGSIDYTYELRSTANMDLIVTITPTVEITSALPGGMDIDLSGLAEVLHNNNPVPDGQIGLPEGVTKRIVVRLQIPGVAPVGIQYLLSVTASAPGLESIPLFLEQTIGQQADPPDPYIIRYEIDPDSVSFNPDGEGNPEIDGIITVPARQTTTFIMIADFRIPDGGSQVYRLVTDVSNTNWTVERNPLQGRRITISGGETTQQLYFDVRPPNAGGPDAVITLELVRDGDGGSGLRRSVSYGVRAPRL